MEGKPMQADQPVLITGASTGIGNHLARTLAGRGITVFATARKETDLAELHKIENVIPIQMDVRQPEQIQAALLQVQKAGKGLYGLVNNAGVGELGFLTTWSDRDMQDIFDVNVFGIHRMTNAFIDLLIESHGRIVNIGSQGGMLSMKYYGPYTMTKHALEAYTVALDQELQPHGVRVSIIQPGGIISNIGNNSFPGTLEHFRNARPPFKEEADQVLAAFSKPVVQEGEQAEQEESENNRKPSSPHIVSEAVLEALFSPKPKLHYLVGTKWEGDRVIHTLLDKLLDENDNPRHNYSRDELISFLDQHISRRKL
jgi:short-subunit dehydrogenase